MQTATTKDAPLVYGHAAFLATLPFLKPAVFHVGGAPVSLPDLAVVAVWGLSAVYALRGRLRVKVDALLVATLIYIGVLLVSALLGSEEPPRKSLIKLAAYSLYLLLPWLTLQIVTDERRLAIALKGFLTGGVVCILLDLVGIAGFYARSSVTAPLACTQYGLLPSGNYPRMCVAFPIPNMLANYLILVLAVILGAGELFPRKWMRGALLAACSVGVLFTLSAGFGGYVLAAIIVIWVWMKDTGRLTPLRRALLLATAAGAGVFFTITMISSFVPPGEGHLPFGSRDVRFFSGSRWTIWGSALDAIRAHPLLGKGYSANVAVTDDPTVFLSPDQIKALNGKSAGVAKLEGHNTWLNVAGQAGLLGLVVYSHLAFRLGKSLTFKKTAGALPYLGVALSAGVAGAVLYHGLFAAIEESRNLWGFLGLLTAAARIRGADLRTAETAPTATPS